MITKKTRLEMYYEHAMCECGGEFLPKPVDPLEPVIDIAVLSPRPKTYVHICNKCGKTEIFLDTYPRIIHEEVNDEKDNTK